MLKEFDNIDALMKEVERDKNASEGSSAFTANRYPVRFVLFDNFRDCREFVSRQTGCSTLFQGIDLWLDPDYPDVMVTHSILAEKIKEFVRSCTKNSIITPFSELARFYDNKTGSEFHSLISTIKSVESSAESYSKHLRVYIPVVGLYGKMSDFSIDSQITIWYVKSSDRQLNYHLVLTDGTTYGVNGLDKEYTVVDSVSKWLEVWKNHDVTGNIICTSRVIYANAEYAQPDNAFEYVTCCNAYDFLTKGLGLNLGFIEYRSEDEHFWQKLASEIDVYNFDFDKFFNSKFGIYDLSDCSVFFNTWFRESSPYCRWLLGAYYTHKFCDKGYVCQVLKRCSNYTDAEFAKELLLSIFELERQVECLEERRLGSLKAAERNIVLPENVQDELVRKISEIEEKSGCRTALEYLTSLTDAEKGLVIRWYSDGKISDDDFREIYPDLYYYLSPTFGTQDESMSWCLKYLDEYKRAKVQNRYTEAVAQCISERNADEVSFNSWYNDFPTVRTAIGGRSDVDTYFWIDGLGMEWGPFISHIVEERKLDGYFLNEVVIARALLPTVTENNKTDLQTLASGQLQKNGDLDSESHKVRSYPSYVISDLKELRRIVNRILDENPGKKIAIVSDHGISYMPQLRPGQNLSGVTGEHGGRFAVWDNGKPVSDSKYKILDDGRTICALRHESLTSKVKEGSGCHGGCTPEEVLVPVFIISNHMESSTCSVIQQTFELSGANAVMSFQILGLSNADIPSLEYAGKKYRMYNAGANVWRSEPLSLVSGVENVRLYVRESVLDYHVRISMGVDENDLFDEF